MSNSSFQSTGTATLSGTTATNMTLVTPAITMTSSADGDIWYHASDKVARLAKGAANTHLIQHASTGVPTWAVPYKVVLTTFNVASTGDIGITGAGFKPSLVHIFGTVSNRPSAGWASSDTLTAVNYYSSNFLYIEGYLVAFGDGVTWSSSAQLKTMDSDGCTLTWTKVGTPTGIYPITCIFFR